MPRKRGGMGPGSLPMGGMGRKPPRPPTPFAAGGPGGGLGAMPSGVAPGPRGMPMAGAVPPGMKRGGQAKKYARGGAVVESAKEEAKEEREEKKEPTKEEVKAHHAETSKHHAKEKAAHYAKGGAVLAGHTTHGMSTAEQVVARGIHKGPDRKQSGAGVAAKMGRADSRTRKPHSGKAS